MSDERKERRRYNMHIRDTLWWFCFSSLNIRRICFCNQSTLQSKGNKVNFKKRKKLAKNAHILCRLGSLFRKSPKEKAKM
jgi:hypothetical protein